MTADTKPMLPAGFKVDTLPGEWFIRCTVCGAAWTLPKGRPFRELHRVEWTCFHWSPPCPVLRQVTDP